METSITAVAGLLDNAGDIPSNYDDDAAVECRSS
jgi:hypothetical protein